MKLLIAVVHSDDADALIDALLERRYYCTKIGSRGGFLRAGNATILIGIEENRLPDVLAIIRANCRTRTQVIEPIPSVAPVEELYTEGPLEVTVGGAIVFMLDVEQFARF